jgi:hypothetical protein
MEVGRPKAPCIVWDVCVCCRISAGYLAALRSAPVSSKAPTSGLFNTHFIGYICTIESPCLELGGSKGGHTAWEKLDELGPHSLCHDLERDRNVFSSYLTGHLPREHPHITDTTHDDLAKALRVYFSAMT